MRFQYNSEIKTSFICESAYIYSKIEIESTLNDFISWWAFIIAELGKGYNGISYLVENGAKSSAQLVEDRLSSLEQKVEQGSTGNTNPTDEWPRKMWEIDLGYKITSMSSFYVGLKSRSFILSVKFFCSTTANIKQQSNKIH